jgi:hypothetical protein
MNPREQTSDAADDLRERLCAMRAELVGKLELVGIDGGLIALLATVQNAIAAVDAERQE